MDKIVILNGIKEHYGFKKDIYLARLLGVTPQTFSNWKRRNKYNTVLLCNKCKEINPEWIISGTGSVSKTYTEESVDMVISSEPSVSYTEDKEEIPVYNKESEIYLQDIYKKGKPLKPVNGLKFIKIPHISDCNAACYVKDNSMSPAIKKGDIVIFKNIALKEALLGEMYLVETEQKVNNKKCRFTYIQILHEIIPEKKIFIFCDKNDASQTREFTFTQIKFIAHIKAVICFQ